MGSRRALELRVVATLPESGREEGVEEGETSKAGVVRQAKLLESPSEGRIGCETSLLYQNCV